MICLERDVAGGIALHGFPQLGQKLADNIIGALQEEQIFSGGVSILHSDMQLFLSNLSIGSVQLKRLDYCRIGFADDRLPIILEIHNSRLLTNDLD